MSLNIKARSLAQHLKNLSVVAEAHGLKDTKDVIKSKELGIDAIENIASTYKSWRAEFLKLEDQTLRMRSLQYLLGTAKSTAGLNLSFIQREDAPMCGELKLKKRKDDGEFVIKIF